MNKIVDMQDYLLRRKKLKEEAETRVKLIKIISSFILGGFIIKLVMENFK